ncbi:hypothetical protein L7F22_022828 [Adiantum nelumboides]|nr:hypothetical protein [Adiantum nelumboides]
MPKIENFATLSPIPGFMGWLLPKLASQVHSMSSGNTQEQDAEHPNVFKEDLLYQWEGKSLLEFCGAMIPENQRAEVVLWNILTSSGQDWISSESMQKVLKPILLRLCARYLLKEKRRGKALDAVTNFHVQNGAVVERLNWMGDSSERGLNQSAGIMVNYVYRLDKIEENVEQYDEKGVISSSSAVTSLLTPHVAGANAPHFDSQQVK